MTSDSDRAETRKQIERMVLLGLVPVLFLVVALFLTMPRPVFIEASCVYCSGLVAYAAGALIYAMWPSRFVLLNHRSSFVHRWARFGGFNNTLLGIIGTALVLGAAPWLELTIAAVAMFAGVIATGLALAGAVMFRLRTARRLDALADRLRDRG